jgi:transcription-repair coupling factor (superfamily II helicase)
MDILDKYFKYDNGIKISGLTPELNAFYVVNFFKKLNKSLIVVTSSLYEANMLYNKIDTIDSHVLLFPMDDFLTSVIVAESPELKLTRLETLKKIKQDDYIVITNLMGYLKFLPSVDTEFEFKIAKKQEIKRDDLVKKLEKFGYHRESIVTSTGEFAVRGFIVDVYLLNYAHPIRFDFFGDEIEELRYFDEETQMSMGRIDNVLVSPIKEMETSGKSNLLDYIGSKTVLFVDYQQINNSYHKIVQDIFEYKTNKNISEKLMYNFEDILPEYEIYLNNIDSSLGKNAITFTSKRIDNYNMDFDKLKVDVLKWQKNNKSVILCLSTDSQIREINGLDLNVKILKQKIGNGFIINDLVVIGEDDLEKNNQEHAKYKNSYKFGKRIKDYNQLETGDYVVHVAHGIGIYNGLVSLSKNGVQKDYLQILYADNDKIYVPVEKITNIYKYGDKDGNVPKINKLNSSTWAKTKAYITKKIKDISRELMSLYEERLKVKKIPFKDYPEQAIFNSQFPYELTRDQQKSVEDILNDLKSDHPMDRLLCGDVGFGKTEVAMRAMFATILNNKQIMYLCPTTILAKQQYEVALKRFKDWPVNIEILDRFITPAKSKILLQKLHDGKIDIIFGTHRLLSKDVLFKNLGLLVVDEEQRFGVTHKEKIKEYKNDVNVLTMSATPIPRTLKMSLSGLRDLSIIDTAPVNRYPVQTYVIAEDEVLIKDAIYQELSRGGQVFILYNNVSSIESKVARLKLLIPEANISFAHGQMNKDELEERMNDFVQKKFDILVCTTIIENGIDIPNVNTLIVYDADRFGLSQLYQIRGRVGRSNKIAYCYLFYAPQKVLNEIAVKRLNSIKEFTELGSGYKIAMRDLSIRGAGDIFGSSQAGFVDSVGISLYMKMIDDEMKRQKGEEVIEEDDNNQSLLNVDTHIDDLYVSDEDVKIEIHQKINEIDSINKFNEVKQELEDRFGVINKQLENYMYEEWFEALASKMGIKRVTETPRLVEIELPEELSNNIEGDKLLMSAFQICHNFNLKYQNKRIKISLLKNSLADNYIIYLIKLLESIQTKSIS